MLSRRVSLLGLPLLVSGCCGPEAAREEPRAQAVVARPPAPKTPEALAAAPAPDETAPRSWPEPGAWPASG